MLTFFGNHVLEEGDLGVYSGSIIDVLGRVGVGEQAVRSTLTRMVNRGLLQRQREGRELFFGLTPQAGRVLIDGRTRSWKQGAVNDDWDGSWTLLGLSLPDSWKRQRHDLRSRLTWSGFGALYSGLWIAPGHVDVSVVVAGLGLTAHVKIFHAQAAEVTDIEQMICDTWDLKSIAARYVAFDERWSAHLENGTDHDPIGSRLRLVSDYGQGRVPWDAAHMPIGRRERAKRAKQAKRERIMAAARDLFAAHGVSGVTAQQPAVPAGRPRPVRPRPEPRGRSVPGPKSRSACPAADPAGAAGVRRRSGRSSRWCGPARRSRAPSRPRPAGRRSRPRA